MKLPINGKIIEVNAEQLASINAAIADVPVIQEVYNQTTSEYEFKLTKSRLKIKAIETLSNLVLAAE